MWQKIIENKDLPEQGTKVIGFSKEWIDEDFNPDGTRECLHCGLDVETTEWTSAKWCNYHDCWHDDTETRPTHWTVYPQPPEI